MPESKAKISYIRIAPRKARLVADLIRGVDVEHSRFYLLFSTKRASVAMLKLLNSAVANAKQIESSVSESDLFIKEVRVDEGPVLRRFRPVSRGRAHPIAKKTSHITIVLGEKEQGKNNKGSKKVESNK